MFAQCLNPDCGAPFDYREGRLVRSCKVSLDGQFPAEESRVEHFWLCGKCSELYVLENDRRVGMKVGPRLHREKSAPELIIAA